MSSARFYFAATNGRELADHPLNGSMVNGCGPSIMIDGEYVHGYRHQIRIGRGAGQVVTAADFGGKAVRVKLWAPNPDARETFLLVPEGFRP